jgi:uncharacterized membrane protein YozB (DUF420 family)
MSNLGGATSSVPFCTPGVGGIFMQSWTRSATLLALWIFVISVIVFAAVFVGWWLIFKPVVPHPAIAIAFAFVLAVIALLLARLLAEKLAEARAPGAPPLRWYYYLAYFCLFIVSAMGTINAAFVVWEGSSIVRQDMGEVRSAYTALDVFARRDLVSAGYNKKKADLEALLANLHEEINNPNGGNYCGVGEAAGAIITQIREIVPQMPIIRGTGAIRPCDPAKAERVYQSYAVSARATLERDQNFLAFHGPEKAEFLEKLATHIQAMRSSFEEMEGLLGDPTAFARAEVQRPLATAAANYNDDYKQAAGLAPRINSTIPVSVDVSQSQELGSFAAFFEILMSRLGDIKTWVYLLIAVLLDFGLVYFLLQAFRRYRYSGKMEAPDPFRIPGSHPKFLWVNPATDSRLEVRHV